MEWVFAIVVGAIIGWLASLIMKTDAQQGAVTNVLVGIVGAVLGRYIFGTVLGMGGAAEAGSLTVPGILYGVLGAVVLLAILRAFGVFGGRSTRV